MPKREQDQNEDEGHVSPHFVILVFAQYLQRIKQIMSWRMFPVNSLGKWGGWESNTHTSGGWPENGRDRLTVPKLWKWKIKKYSLAVTQDRETGFSAVNSSKLPHQLMRLDSILTSQNKMAAEDQYLLLWTGVWWSYQLTIQITTTHWINFQ
jgi:hypothetical protein